MCKSRTSLHTVRNFSFPAGKCEQFTAKGLDCETKRPDPSQSKHLETATMKIEVDVLAVPTTRTTTITMTEGRPRPNLRSARRACRYWTRVDRTAADPDEWLDAAVRGAFVIALSRSFAEEVDYDDDVDGGEARVEVENVLLPLIDVLQHSNDPNTTLEPFDDCVVLRARRDVAAGEELFHCYREENDDVIPPHKFFTRYGFVPGAREPIPELLKRRSRLFFDS